MTLKRKFLMGFISLTAALSLAACSGESDETSPNKDSNTEENTANESNTEENAKDESGTDEHDSHAGMDHSGTGEIPEGLKEAENPTYEVGSKALINDDHMPGMKGAEATIVGAFTTTVYSVSYDPTTGGKRVEKHEWVIHEELKDAGDQPLKPGDEATISAEHMAGMSDAKAVIDTAEETTVYMVDFTPLDGGEPVTNHMWVTEDELSPAE